MKTIIAGSRDINSEEIVKAAIKQSGFVISEVVCGGAQGVDEVGRRLAIYNQIPTKLFPADWSKHGKAAGPIRNAQMAEYADALIAVWDGKSRGTKNMIEEAKKRGLKVYVSQPSPLGE